MVLRVEKAPIPDIPFLNLHCVVASKCLPQSHRSLQPVQQRGSDAGGAPGGLGTISTSSSVELLLCSLAEAFPPLELRSLD